MLDADALNTVMKALTHEMKTDTRFSADDRASLVVIDAVLDADGDTTKQQDMIVVKCLKQLCCQEENY
jgi:hypothetical protein